MTLNHQTEISQVKLLLSHDSPGRVRPLSEDHGEDTHSLSGTIHSISKPDTRDTTHYDPGKLDQVTKRLGYYSSSVAEAVCASH